MGAARRVLLKNPRKLKYQRVSRRFKMAAKFTMKNRFRLSPPTTPTVDLLFKELMEADEIIRPMLLATWRLEHPLLVEDVYRMWDEFCAPQIEGEHTTRGREFENAEPICEIEKRKRGAQF